MPHAILCARREGGRSGVIDMALEGKMLSPRCRGPRREVATGSTLALGAGCGIAIALSWLHGFATVSLAETRSFRTGDQHHRIGLTVVLAVEWFQQGGRQPQVSEQCA